MNEKYIEFLKSKVSIAKDSGFEISDDDINPILLPHQRDAVKWAIKGGRKGLGIELNPDYYCDGVSYMKDMEVKMNSATLFDVEHLKTA